MKPSAQNLSLHYLPVTLSITQHDIEAMDYYLNECPMANPSSQNAVALALRRIMKPEAVPIWVILDREGNALASTRGYAHVPLGNNLGTWLKDAIKGKMVTPIQDTVFLPRDLLPRDLVAQYSVEASGDKLPA